MTVEFTPLKRRPLIFSTPEGPKFISAASGLVTTEDKIYTVADNDLNLGILGSGPEDSFLERILPGSLPIDEKLRKKQKPDFESLFRIDDPRLPQKGLVAFPSGSSLLRYLAVFIPIQENGSVSSANIMQFNLSPFFDPIFKRHGFLNIEGAFIEGDRLILFHRGNSEGDRDRFFEYDKSEFIDVILGMSGSSQIAPREVGEFNLGLYDGVQLTITDAVGFEGRRFFIAAAEATTNSIDDGEIKGSVFGELLNRNEPLIYGFFKKVKTEGLSLRRLGVTLEVRVVTDNDRPDEASELLTFEMQNILRKI